MIRIHLQDSEKEALEHAFKTTEDARLRERCQAILMVSRQRPRKEIAEDLGIDKRTLQRWVKAYLQGGLQGLRIQWAPGKSPLIPKSMVPQIIEWVKKGPAGCGLERANWPHMELATYLFKKTGIRVCESTMGEFCRKYNIRPYRPTYDYRKANQEDQAKAQQELAELKKKRNQGN